MVCASVLVHNGYFKDVARLGICVAVAMTLVGGYALFAQLDIVRFLQAYAAVYACGALGSGGADGARAVPPGARALGRAGDALALQRSGQGARLAGRGDPQRRRAA